LPVATVIENLEDLSVDEVMEQFDVTREQITAVLDFVAQTGAMARIVGPRVLPDSHVTIPGLKPPVREFVPSDDGDAREVDAFNQMIRELRIQSPAVPPSEAKPPR
jgi:hypothetical protein